MTRDLAGTTSERSRHIALRLYIAGGTPSSRRADANLRKALDQARAGIACEVIDVLADARRAMTDNVIVTPTLVGSAGKRRLVLVGDLSDVAKLSGFLASLSDAE